MYAIEQLEFAKFKKIIASHCHSTLGKKIVWQIHPFSQTKDIRERAQFIDEIQECILQKDFSFSNLQFTKELLFDFEHQTYNFEECKKIIANVSIANAVFSDVKELESFPLVTSHIQFLSPQEHLEERFHQIFDADGAVLDSASSALRSIRSQKISLRKNIEKSLQDSLSVYGKYLQDTIITRREGRFVIPVKEGAAPFVKGILHGRSGSKASVFVEPENVVQLNNNLEMVSTEEKQEIFRILQEFTAEILSQKETLIQNEEMLASLDFHFACARWANRVEAVIPELSQTPYIKLEQARHPLLIETLGSLDKVIPFDLELGTDFKTLIISGPNTGGKTVTLKTIGLLSLIALSGLPIPAEESSSIFPFTHVFADIGDQQSLENALSTFSSHITAISQMTKFATETSLILIDEIGAATDPEQGSALAQAILEEFTKKQVVGVITTHYTALKLFAENHPDCQNAAMQFDADKHIPTYQFKLGLPGNSFAIEVASHLGFPKHLITRAKELTGHQSVELADILKRMNEEKKALSRQLYEYRLKTSLLEKKISEYEEKIEMFEEQKKAIKKQSLRDARDYLVQIQKEMNKELKEMKKKEKEKREIEQSIQQVMQKSKTITNDLKKMETNQLEPIKNPYIGQKVWLSEMETEGEIIELSTDSVKIDLDGMIFTTGWNKIFEIDKQEKKETKIYTNYNVKNIQAKFELNIIGYRFDDALPLLEKFLDSAEYNGLQKVRIVHGKGTGALRTKVRQYLSRQKRVKEFYTPAPEAGGAGVTIAVIG